VSIFRIGDFREGRGRRRDRRRGAGTHSRDCLQKCRKMAGANSLPQALPRASAPAEALRGPCILRNFDNIVNKDDKSTGRGRFSMRSPI
jgi:hypothetical protein